MKILQKYVKMSFTYVISVYKDVIVYVKYVIIATGITKINYLRTFNSSPPERAMNGSVPTT